VRTAALERLLSLPRPHGSNNWAVDGRFTADGRPLIAGDPHLAFDFFGAPYPLHVNSADGRGTYDVAGFAYPGTPGIALGQTRSLVWTCTSAFADVMDTWEVTRVDGGVLVAGEVAPIEYRTEQIVVREPDGPVGEGRTEVRVYEDVDGFGVVLPEELLPVPFGDFVVGWTGYRGRPARWFMELNRAGDLDEFEAAVDRMVEMNYNFVAADPTGIAMRVGVETPLRNQLAPGREPWLAMDAADPESMWPGGMLDRARMPGSRALERGFLVTANNDPFGFTANGRLDDDPWYYGSFFAPGYRAHRIEQELAELTGQGGVELADMMALQTDHRSGLADDLVPMLESAWQGVDTDPELAGYADQEGLAELVELLSGWDRRMVRESAGAVAFAVLARLLAEDVLADDIPLAWDFAVELQTVAMIKIAMLALQGAFPGQQVVAEVDVAVLDAASDTAAWLIERFGAVDPSAFSYADLKVTSLDHALGYGMPLSRVPTDGWEDTVDVSQNISFAPDAEQWITSYVPVERTVARFDEDGVPELHVACPLWSSEPDDPDSQAALDDYVEGRHRRLLFDREEIEGALRERIELRR